MPGALPRQVVEQQVRDLRDREHEDEVEEELERRRPLLVPVVVRTLEAAHRGSVLRRIDNVRARSQTGARHSSDKETT